MSKEKLKQMRNWLVRLQTNVIQKNKKDTLVAQLQDVIDGIDALLAISKYKETHQNQE